MNPFDTEGFELANVEAEQCVLGALLVDATAIDRIGALTPADFHAESHRLVWSAIERMSAAGQPVDVLTVDEALRESGDSERVGGLAFLGQLASTSYMGAMVARHAQIVRERSMLRRLVGAATECVDVAKRIGLSPAQKIDHAQALMMALGDQAKKGHGPRSITEVLSSHMERIEQRMTGQVSALSTGLDDVDRALGGGLRGGQLMIVAARPAMGKTSLAMQIALAFAERGDTALFCSQEMPEADLADRAVCLMGRIPLPSIVSGQMRDHEWAALTAATGRLHEKPLYLDEQPALTLMDVRSKARQVARTAGLKLLVVDYLQLMSGQGDNRNAEIEAISRGLKQLAKEMDIPVIALSQLNRGVEARANKRPMASDLRDSGAIEQDADIIAFIYRDEVYNPDSPDKGMAEFIIGKQRQGASGQTVRLTFLGEYTRFESFTGVYEPRESRPVRARRGFAE